MSRAALCLITGAVGLAGIGSAGAGECCDWGGGPGVVYTQPQVYYAQPAPTIVQVTPPPIVVQVGRPQIIVQQTDFYQAPVPIYLVDQGPVYSGPGADYSWPVYQPPQPIRPYPYVSSDYGWGYPYDASPDYRRYRRSGHAMRPQRVYGNYWRHHSRWHSRDRRGPAPYVVKMKPRYQQP